jgi:hypothetical protein
MGWMEWEGYTVHGVLMFDTWAITIIVYIVAVTFCLM